MRYEIPQNIFEMKNEKGYTMIEVIIVALIIGILLTIGTAHYLEAQRMAVEQLCATRLAQIDALQKMYYRQYSEYATFQELQAEGFIDSAYTPFDDVLSQATPYVPEYTLTFNVSGDRYQVIAETVHGDFNGVYVRWRAAGGQQDKRAMSVDQTGVVRYLYNNRPVF
ncbi:prepilin-type N-terminal cleavage/methylation domain-containing protein [bacterium]|nr:prepilin-type N-terminal cleavage/methylation domain-containing protein [bacterium]MBU1025432.1 prepilin-type N-terminal cleavage/methylation domain-containing protein [bacterium]